MKTWAHDLHDLGIGKLGGLGWCTPMNKDGVALLF